ncbi:MAG: 3-isopropylmalate dehydrogenase [Planctomycetota bacterium]
MTATRTSTLAVLPGDGIGPEVTAAAVAVLEVAASRFGFGLRFEEALLGGAAIDACGDPFPAETRAVCEAADGIFLGAVGGPRWEQGGPRPEAGLLGIRKAFGLYANLRPVAPILAVAEHASPIRADRLQGVDVVFVRELTGGIYFGEKRRTPQGAVDTCAYTVTEIERVVTRAAHIAMGRKRLLTSVDKANVLETSRLWREVTERVVRTSFPALQLEHVLVDAMAMHLLARPADFDVVVTENLFGDVLTDEASMLAGSMGLLPSASLGDGTLGLYEPIHGSAPDLAGRGVANPCGAILSAALFVRHTLGREDVASAIERAVCEVVTSGPRTPDLGGRACTADVTAAVVSAIEGSPSSAP